MGTRPLMFEAQLRRTRVVPRERVDSQKSRSSRSRGRRHNMGESGVAFDDCCLPGVNGGNCRP